MLGESPWVLSWALVSTRKICQFKIWLAKAAVCAGSNLGPYLAYILIYMAGPCSTVCLTVPL